MIPSLKDAINTGKISGDIQSVQIKYFIKNIDSVLVNSTVKKDVKVIKGTKLKQSQFELEVSNAFTQWQIYLNNLYNLYVVVEFVKSDDEPDITVEFSSFVETSEVKNRNQIILSTKVDWTTCAHNYGILLLNHLVKGIGEVFGVGHNSGISPLNSSFLGTNFVKSSGLKINLDGAIQSSFLPYYPEIKSSIVSVYGTSKIPLPLIFGCTNPNSSNYNPEATVDNGLCIFDTEKVENRIAYNRSTRSKTIDYLSNPNQYFLANSNSIYSYSLGVFDTESQYYTPNIPEGEQDFNLLTPFTDNAYPLTSLAITDKGAGSYGDSSGIIRYYILASQSGDFTVFNKNGEVLSGLQLEAMSENSAETRTPEVSEDVFLGSFNFIYQSKDENHYVYWISKNGVGYNLELSDTESQLNASGEIVAACDLDTYSFGNVVSLTATQSVGGTIVDENQNPISISNGKFNKILHLSAEKLTLAGDYFSYSQGSIFSNGSFNDYSFDNSISNMKNCFIPTIAGLKAITIDLYSNFLKISSLDSNTTTTVGTWVGDTVAGTSGLIFNAAGADGIFNDDPNTIEKEDEDNQYHINIASTPLGLDYNTADTSSDRGVVTRNTPADLHPFFSHDNEGRAMLRPFSLGFSFDNSSIKDFIFEKEWSEGSFKISSETRIASAQEFANHPICIGNRLFRNSYFASKEHISFLAFASASNSPMQGGSYYLLNQDFSTNDIDIDNSFVGDDYNDFLHVGDFHLAIGVKHGFLLTKINNTNFSLVSPTTENGLEVHVPGGHPDMADFNGGWSILSMCFSPQDNFLYTIIQNPEDSSDRKITIYQIHPGNQSGCTDAQLSTNIANNAIVVEAPNDMSLEKVTLQDDGAIYFWSSSNDYVKISDPDLLVSVQAFQIETIGYSLAGAEYLPSKSYVHKNSLHQGSFVFRDSYSADDPRIKYIESYSSNEATISIGEGLTLLNNKNFNSKIVGQGFTYDISTNQLVTNSESYYPQSIATQTFNDAENNGVAAYLIEQNNDIIFQGGQGSQTRVTLATSVEDVDYKDSIFIRPRPGKINQYYIGYDTISNRGKTITTIGNVSVSGDPENLIFEVIPAIENSNPFAAAEQNMTRAKGSKVQDLGDGRFIMLTSFISNYGADFNEGNYRTHIRYTEFTSSGITLNPDIHTLHALNLGTGNTPDGGFYTTIAISPFADLIAVATMSKDSTALKTKCAISIYDFNSLNSNQPLIGSQIGNSLFLDTETFLVDEDLIQMTETVVRGLEFSSNGTKLYALLGKHGNLETRVVSQLSKTNRALRLKVDKENDIFGFDGALQERQQYQQPDQSRVNSIFTFTDGLSDQGNSAHKNNTAMVGLYKDASLNVRVSNILGDGYIFVGGVITNSNTQYSILHRTATVIEVESEVRDGEAIGADGSKGSGGTINNDTNPTSSFGSGGDGDEILEQIQVELMVTGCTDPLANNYNPTANSDDGTCQYGTPGFESPPQFMGGASCSGACPAVHVYGEYFPAVVEALSDKLDSALDGCDNIEQQDQTGGGRRAAIANYFSPSSRNIEDDVVYGLSTFDCVKNENCSCQATYYITSHLSFDTESAEPGSAPWASIGCGIINVSVNWVYIPIQKYQINYQPDPNTPASVTGFVWTAWDLDYPGDIFVGENFVLNSSDNYLQWEIDPYTTPSVYPYGTNPPTVIVGNNFQTAGEAFDEAYCVTCTDSSTPEYDNVTSAQCEEEGDWCTENNSISNCKAFGCTDTNACNFNGSSPNWVESSPSSCIYPPSGVNQHGVDVGTICGCNGEFLNAASGLDYCGSCADPDNIYPQSNTIGCDCNGEAQIAPIGIGYYGSCDGLLPTVLEESYGCFYDSSLSGTLYEPSGGVIGACDCQGGMPFGPGCNCSPTQGDKTNTELVNNTAWCDCNTPSKRLFPDPDGNGYAQCDSQHIDVCLYSTTSNAINLIPTVNYFHSSTSSNDFTTGLAGTFTQNGNKWFDLNTGNAYEDEELFGNNATWIEGPVNLDICEPCAEEGPNGEPQEYENCIPAPNQKCKYLVTSTSVSGETTIEVNPVWGQYFYSTDCAQCVAVGDFCCSVYQEGDTIPAWDTTSAIGDPKLDVCGSCINYVTENGGTYVTDQGTGSYLIRVITSSGALITVGWDKINCNPCTAAGGFINQDYQPSSSSQLVADLEGHAPDYCQECGGSAYFIDYGQYLGYIGKDYAEGVLRKCTCDDTYMFPSLLEDDPTHPFHPSISDCCDGYFWDPCAFNGAGGCREVGNSPIPKDCQGNCGVIIDTTDQTPEYVFQYGINGCGECTQMRNADIDEDPDEDTDPSLQPGGVGYLLGATAEETYNAVGCCLNYERGCDYECQPPESILEIDQCGVCGGDNTVLPNGVTPCAGCMDESAFNYGSYYLISTPETCNYSSLYSTIEEVVVSAQGTPAPNIESVFFIPYIDPSVSNEDTDRFEEIVGLTSTQILNNPVTVDASIINSALGGSLYDMHETPIFIDQPYYTQKCQVIDHNNTILHISNPQYNAEITYFFMNEAYSIPITQSSGYQTIPYTGSSPHYIPAYYFRIKDEFLFTEQHAKEIFSEHLDKIHYIEDSNGNTFYPNAGYYTQLPIPESGNAVEHLKLHQGVKGILIDEDSQTTHNQYHVYKIVPKYTWGQVSMTFELDFAQFLETPYPGCMDETAFNYNANANVDNGTCEHQYSSNGTYELVIIGSPNNESNLKWVMYNDANQIIYNNFGSYPATFNQNGVHSIELPNLTGCVYFLPIGFRYSDDWAKVELYITTPDSLPHVLKQGVETRHSTANSSGAILLDVSENETCTLGCNSGYASNVVKTDYCAVSVRKDSTEFTDIFVTLEFESQEEDGWQDGEFFIIDLDNGKKLAAFEFGDISNDYGSDYEVPGQEDSSMFGRKFSIASDTRIGVYAEFGVSTFKLNIVSEYGETIINETIKQ